MSSETPSHNAKDPLAWVVQHTGHIAEGGRVLDVACGSGRHTRYLLDLGFRVTAIDRDISRLADIIEDESLRVLEYDLEDGTPWPLPGETFDGIVITNYLFRPLFPRLAEALSEGGVLIYQTFAAGNEAYGKPRNPDFLLLENELQEFFGEKFKVLAFHQGFVETPSPAVVQRICCRK
ncbi:MAG: SAM-dependent methyltransferase [Rhodospirillaceae bacterium]|nr:SAM-dependent methyltransferase [Rhodospirillaceae bacterium]